MDPNSDQGLYSATTLTLAASSIMQVTRGQCSGSHLLTTGCHAMPPRSVWTGTIQGPAPEANMRAKAVWLAVLAGKESGEGNLGH